MLDPESQRQPDFIMNFDVAGGEWRRVEFELLPPACVPVELHDRGMGLLVTGTKELVQGGLEDGIQLTVDEMKMICRALGIQPKSPGSGKNGNVVKIDWASALIHHFFPQASEEKRAELLKRICRAPKAGSTNVEMLEHVAQLDPENQQAFKKQIKDAMESLEDIIQTKARTEGAKQEKARTKKELDEATARKTALRMKLKEKAHEESQAIERAARTAEVERMWGCTPPFLKQLLPGKGTITSTFYAAFHPKNCFFKVTYPCSAASAYIVPLSLAYLR